ncbi:hypothetical protein [Ensifer sp. B1-9]|uniref:hypothetical protein n=1 Tax=Ensifer sp. B1-9 TaxID=3141455 RepID=UPI003D1F3CBF
MSVWRSLSIAALASLWLAGASMAQPVREPAKGSAERAAILDAIRPAVEAEMRGPVEFVVTTMRASPNWAFMQVEPQRPGGGAIDLAQTGLRVEAEMMDGRTVFAQDHDDLGRSDPIINVIGSFKLERDTGGKPRTLFLIPLWSVSRTAAGT